MRVRGRTLKRAERALGIKFYEWQKKYIKRERYDEAELSKRANGRTLAYIVRYLLESGGRVSDFELANIADYPQESCKEKYAKWFIHEARKINEKLKAAGIYNTVESWKVLTANAAIWKDYIALLPTIVISNGDARYNKPTLEISVHFAVFNARIKFIKTND